MGAGAGAGGCDRERAWRHFPHPAAAARNRGQGHSQWAAANNNDIIIIVTLADAWPNLLPPSVPRCWHRLHESKDVLFVRVPHGLFTFLAKRFAALLVAQHIPLLVLCKTLTPPPATGRRHGDRDGRTCTPWATARQDPSPPSEGASTRPKTNSLWPPRHLIK